MSNFGIDFRQIARVPFGQLVKNQPPPGTAPLRPVDEARQGKRAFLGKTNRRRFACLKSAEEALDVLPAEGETLYAIMSGLYDLQHLLIVILDRLGTRCEVMRIATLSLSRRNVQEMVTLFDGGKVGKLDVLTSDFFRRHDKGIFDELCLELHQRGQHVGSARSHCKIVTLALEDGRKYALSGSPNLRTNKNQEQFCLTQSAELHSFYDTWLVGMIEAHEVHNEDGPAKG